MGDVRCKILGGHDANMRRNWWERPKALATNLMILKLERIKDFLEHYREDRKKPDAHKFQTKC